MIFNLYKCDGCGGEARTEQKAGVPVGRVQFQFLSAVRIRVSKAIIACSRRRGRGAIAAVMIPSWAIGDVKDGPSLASALSLAELENRWLRLSAATQRAALGFPVFGKRAIFSNGVEVRTMHSAAFGTDANVDIWSWAQVTRAARERRLLWAGNFQ